MPASYQIKRKKSRTGALIRHLCHNLRRKSPPRSNRPLRARYYQSLMDIESTQRGIAEGEHKRALEAARNALAMGLSAEQAAQITGLPLDEVQALQEA